MVSRTLVSRLLDAADLLIAEGGKSSAFRRRAVSTAYYAVFHALAKLCADELLQSSGRASDEYSRVYRALEHGKLKSAFVMKNGPLHQRANLRRIGELTIQLQTERHRADYLPPIRDVFPFGKAEQFIEQARTVVEEIAGLSAHDRRTLATHLLFKSRP
jgi:uncharacterized protein (UPF0332 family)